jgi:hypothetical protein
MLLFYTLMNVFCMEVFAYVLIWEKWMHAYTYMTIISLGIE